MVTQSEIRAYVEEVLPDVIAKAGGRRFKRDAVRSAVNERHGLNLGPADDKVISAALGETGWVRPETLDDTGWIVGRRRRRTIPTL